MRRGRTRAAQFQHLMPPGIQREGFSCFLIAGVQLLRAVHTVYNTLRGFQYLDRDRMTNEMRMTEQLSILYNREGRGSLNFVQFVRNFQPVSRGLPEGELQLSHGGRVAVQNDASEYLRHLLNNFETPAGEPLIGNDTIGEWIMHIDRDGNEVRDFKRELQCYFPDNDVNGFTLITEGILTGLHNTEDGSDDRLTNIEEYFFVEVARYGWDWEKGIAFKNLRSVIMEMELDVTPFCTATLATELRTQGRHKYELRGVVCHDGETTGEGHYRTFLRLDHEENVWCECDDANVTFKEQEEIADLGKSCYLLLYRRSAANQPEEDIHARSSSSNNTQQDAAPSPPDNKDVTSDEISDNMSVDILDEKEELEEEKQESKEDAPSRKRRKTIQKPKSPPPESDDDPDSSEDEWEPLPEDESDSDYEDENLFAVDGEEVEDLEFKDICEEDYDENEEETQASENLPWQGIPKSAPPSKICNYPDCKKPWPVDNKRAHHWEYHTGPYACPVCGEILERRSTLNKHVVSEHGSLIGLDRSDILKKRRNPAANLKEFRDQIGVDVTNVPVEKITLINCGKFILYVEKGTGKLILAVHEVRRMQGEKAEDLPDEKSRHFEYERKEFKYVPPHVVNHQKLDNAHAVPRADFVSAKYQSRTMNLLNRIPFVPEMNRRVSKQIEELGRKLAPKYAQEIQFTIPVYGEDNRVVPGGLILPVPTGLFRVLYLKDKKGDVTIQPYLIPNDRKVSFKHYLSFASSYKEIELLTGVRLFRNLENAPAPTWNSYVPVKVDFSEDNIFEQQQNLKEKLEAAHKDMKKVWEKNKPLLATPAPKGSTFRCSYTSCGQVFGVDRELQIHQLQHREKACHRCKEVFDSWRDLRKHLEKKEGEQWDHCYSAECQEALYQDIITHHQQQHYGATECGICGLSCSGSNRCTHHIYSRHSEYISCILPVPEFFPNYKSVEPAQIIERSGAGIPIQKSSFSIRRGATSTLYSNEFLTEKVEPKQGRRTSHCYYEDKVEHQTSAEAIHYAGGHLGHMAAVGNYREKSESERDTMSYINVEYMNSHINVSTWKSLENFQRACGNSTRTVQVVTGAINKKEKVPVITSLCGEEVQVPSAFFKVLLVHVPGVANFLFVFIVPNLKQRSKTFVDFRSSLEQIKELTGLNFAVQGEFEDPWTWGQSNKGFPCKIKGCAKVFLLQENLAEHTANMHPFNCPRCRQPFPTEDKKKEHARAVHDYTCPVCKKWFYSRHMLQLHMRTHTGEKPFECGFCPRRFKHAKDRDTHHNIHLDKKPFKCNICDSVFFSSPSLNTHQSRKHPAIDGKFRFQCETCNLPFGSKTDLDAHQVLHDLTRKILCIVEGCTFRFNQEKNMFQHVRFRHADLEEVQQFMIGRFSHICPTCRMGFETECGLTPHIATHMLEKPFQCKPCSASFKTKAGLAAHIKAVHPTESKDIVLCQYPGCKRPFKSETWLLKHQLDKHKDLGEEDQQKIKSRQKEIDNMREAHRQKMNRIRSSANYKKQKASLSSEEFKAKGKKQRQKIKDRKTATDATKTADQLSAERQIRLKKRRKYYKKMLERMTEEQLKRFRTDNNQKQTKRYEQKRAKDALKSAKKKRKNQQQNERRKRKRQQKQRKKSK